VSDISDSEYVEREMVLIRVKAEAQTRAEVLRVIDIFRGKVVDLNFDRKFLQIGRNRIWQFSRKNNEFGILPSNSDKNIYLLLYLFYVDVIAQDNMILCFL
ncbi:MAG: hypothetical protein D3905_14315, partial [Candidatus Electrothrix sp. AS4_5]|nr:hypothetical protein [Candidatus Electrothrix gigas]